MRHAMVPKWAANAMSAGVRLSTRRLDGKLRACASVEMIEDGAAALEPISSSSSPIWLVEDSPLEAEIAKRALSDFNVEVFSDGPAMLERRSTHGSPSILILDGQLPTLSGLEICKFLRASVDAVTLPILMLTVQGNKADIVEALSAGANDYVTKPYDAAELVARVRGLARMRRLYD